MSKLSPWAYEALGYLKHTATKKAAFIAKPRKTNSYLIAAFCCIATISTASACTIGDDGTTPSPAITFPDQDDAEDTTTTTEPSEETTDPQQDSQTDDEIGDLADTDMSEPEAVESLAVVLAQPHPGTMRGESTSYLSEQFPYEIEPVPTLLTARFESDAEGDVAVLGHIPTKNDPELAQDTEMEFRYVGDDTVYRRWTRVGSEEAEHTWQPLIINTVGAEDNEEAPDAQEAELLERILCVFPFEFEGNTFIQCDPYRSSLVLLESAQNAQVLGVEDVRDVETLVIGFQMPLTEMSESLIESYKSLAEQMIALYSTIDFDELLSSGDPSGDLGSLLDEDTDLAAAYTEAIDSINSAVALLENADLEVHVNVDAEARIRRIVIDIGAAFDEMLEMLESEQGIGDSETAAIEDFQYIMEFYDFGADISVEAPAQEQISDSATWPPVFNQS